MKKSSFIWIVVVFGLIVVAFALILHIKLNNNKLGMINGKLDDLQSSIDEKFNDTVILDQNTRFDNSVAPIGFKQNEQNS